GSPSAHMSFVVLPFSQASCAPSSAAVSEAMVSSWLPEKLTLKRKRCLAPVAFSEHLISWLSYPGPVTSQTGLTWAMPEVGDTAGSSKAMKRAIGRATVFRSGQDARDAADRPVRRDGSDGVKRRRARGLEPRPAGERAVQNVGKADDQQLSQLDADVEGE